MASRKMKGCHEHRIDTIKPCDDLLYVYGNNGYNCWFTCSGPMRVIAEFASQKGVSKEVVDKLKENYNDSRNELSRPSMLMEFLVANLPGTTVGELVELLKDDDIYK